MNSVASKEMQRDIEIDIEIYIHARAQKKEKPSIFNKT